MFQWKLGVDLDQFGFGRETFATDCQLVPAGRQCTNGKSAGFVSFEPAVHTRCFTNDHDHGPYTTTGRIGHLKPQLPADPLCKCKGCASTNRQKKPKTISH